MDERKITRREWKQVKRKTKETKGKDGHDDLLEHDWQLDINVQLGVEVRRKKFVIRGDKIDEGRITRGWEW